MNTEGTTKILVVEDKKINGQLFMEILHMGNYQCFHAWEGDEALRIAAREHPDLILLDIELPGRNGFELLQALRSKPDTRYIKTIAITAHTINGDGGEKFFKRGFDGVIAKPVQIAEFLKEIQNILQIPGSPVPSCRDYPR